MIIILDSNLRRKKIVKKAITSNRFEEINGENTLTFSAVLDEKTGYYLDENAVIEMDNDYFDIALLKKDQNQDGTLTVEAETEHVSYRLNNPEYNMDTFASTGTTEEVLADILEGTGFTVGTVEITGNVTYSAQEKKSRRMLLMEYVNFLGGEAKFDKFTVSIVQHRGNTKPKLLAKGKNIKVVSKVVNKRERDESGNPLISYICEPIMLPNKPFELGDEVLLVQKDLGIREQLRIVRLGYNPYDKREAEIELANFISGLEDDIYRIETSSVRKEKVYNGCKIGPEEGFVATKTDKTVKSVMNATEGISIQLSDDNGNTWEAVFYVVVVDGVPKLYLGGPAVFTGAVTGATIKTAETGPRIEITGVGIKSFNALNQLHGIVFDPAATDADFSLFYNGNEYFKIRRYGNGIGFFSMGDTIDDAFLLYGHLTREVWANGIWDFALANVRYLEDSGYASQYFVDRAIEDVMDWVEDNFEPKV